MARKGQSKRQTLHQKYKIQKRVKEYNRKMKRAAKQNKGAQWRSKQEANIPNDWPFKDQMLAEIERQRGLEAEAEAKNREVRKAEAKKKKEVKATESMLPKGMGAPAPIPASTSNAILADAYTKRVWKEIKQTVEESDIILEILDARDPLGSRCFEMEQWVSGKLAEKTEKQQSKKGASEVSSTKPIILVLNKTDLVPPAVTQNWLSFFAKHDHLPAIAFYTNKELEKHEMKGQNISVKDMCPGSEALLQLLANYQSSNASDDSSKPLKVGIVGFANVGKSSVLNCLARTHASGVGPISGYTKQLHRFKLAKGLYAIDTPGLPTKEEAPGPHIHLNIPNAQGELLQDLDDFIQHFEMENLMSVLHLPQVESMTEFLDALAMRAGRQIKGGDMNHYMAARKLFKDWNEGKYSYFTMPPGLDDGEEDKKTKKESNPISAFFAASNKKSIVELKKRPNQVPENQYLAVNGSLFDKGDDDDEDEDDEDEDGEDEDDEEMEDGEDEDMEDEEEEEEEEEVPPPPPSKKKSSAPAAVAASAASKSKKAAPAPAAAAPAASRKRQQRDEEEEDDDEEEEEERVVKPAQKKQAAAPKSNSNKPTPAPAASASKKKQKK